MARCAVELNSVQLVYQAVSRVRGRVTGASKATGHPDIRPNLGRNNQMNRKLIKVLRVTMSLLLALVLIAAPVELVYGWGAVKGITRLIIKR
jgi:hypothetical protein